MKPETSAPFLGDFETLKSADIFDLHKLKKPDNSIGLPGGAKKDFQTAEYAVTEYFSDGKKDHESFVHLKRFFEEAQAGLGDILPKSFFVEGEPSNGDQGKSFYVVQKFGNPEFNKTAKNLNELNTGEFSGDFLKQLLVIQERIMTFLEKHTNEFPDEWMNKDSLDEKGFKEDMLFSPETGEIKLANFFKLTPEAAKQVTGSEVGFEPSKNRFVVLKLIGLARLVEKINWAIEKSAAPEWIKGQGVHWRLDKAILEREGKKAMALTFDDGPNEETEKLLDILKQKGVKATFFLVGSQIDGREHIVKRIIDEGHDVGVHEWGQEGAKPSAGVKEYMKRFVGPRRDLGDVKKTTELISWVTGKKPVLGRIAGVHGTIDSIREFQAMGLDIIHGNPYDVVAMAPGYRLTSGKLLKRALSSNGQGRIRIFHIGTMKDSGTPTEKSEINFANGEVYPPEETLKMIGQYIDETKKQGYEFVKVKDYLN